MFLGTPHFAHQSEWTKFSSDIMKCFDDQKIEPTAWNFGLLGHIKDEFYSLLGERKEAGNELKVCFFFETRPVYRVGIVGTSFGKIRIYFAPFDLVHIVPS